VDIRFDLNEEEQGIINSMPLVTEDDIHPLEHVDDETKIKIIAYCSENPVFFAHMCRDANPEGNVAIKPYDKQIDIMRGILIDHYVIILGSRQTGKTTIVYVVLLWMVIFFKNYRVGILMQKDEVIKSAIAALDKIYNLLPTWLKPDKSVDNTKEKLFTNGSKLQGFAIDPKNPEHTGRSLKVDLLVIDEAAFVKSIDVVYTALKPVTSRRHLRLKRNGLPYGTVIVSTPNGQLGIGEWFYKFWISAEAGNNGYKAIRFHWSEVPEYDDEWYENTTKDMDERQKNQEYELKFLGSKDAFFEDFIIDRLQKPQYPKPINSIRLKHRSILLWDNLDLENTVYLIGADPANTGSDYAAIVLFDYYNNKIVGLYYDDTISVSRFTEDVEYLCELIPNSLLGYENNALGAKGAQDLYDKIGDRLFVHKTHRNKKEKYKYAGISTNKHSRTLMMDALYDWVKDNAETIDIQIIVYNLIALERKGNRIEAADNLHDDAALALSFILYMINHGDISDLLSQLRKTDKEQIKQNIELVIRLNQDKYVPSDDIQKMEQQASEFENSVLNIISNNTEEYHENDIERNAILSNIFGVS